ncbi:Srebp protein, partial [Fasciola gigantica]
QLAATPIPKYRDSVVTESTKVTEKPVRRAPHNAIEKRYRASINGRIDELRKILIPFPSADAKLNKSAVLRQAVDRIKELEKKNERLLAEVRMWRQLHAVHVAKTESNSSPESGISLDPSPIPSNFNAHGFGRFSPPSVGESCVGGGGGGSLYSAASTIFNAPSTASPTELTSLVDMKEHICPTPWSFSMSSPEKPDSTGFPTVSNGGVPQLDTLFDEYLFDRTVYGSSGSDDVYALHADVPSHKSAINRVADTSDCGSYTVMTPGPVQAVYNTSFNPVARNSQSRGKRGNCATNGAPTKLRRSLTSNAVRSGDQSFGPVPDSALSQPGDVQFQSTMSDPYRSSLAGTELSLPGVHRVLSQPPIHPGSNSANARSDTSKVSDTHERVGAVSTTGSRFHNLAARTTLCVSALCLVALDPSVLTSKTIGSESPGTGAGTARRLLTISSSLGSSFSSWINCTLYLVQWLVALLFCFWAWKRGTVRTATGRSSRRWRRSVIAISDLAAARAHWVKANNAINQGAMNSSVKNLHQCLVDLAQPLPHTAIQNGFGNKLISWSSLSLSLANLCCIRMPFFVCRTWYNRLSGYFFHTRSSVSSTSNEAPSLTAAMVRSRLLELCVLERHHSVRSAQMAVDRLSFAHLLVRCCHEFLDAPTDGNPDQWARKGVVLALAVGHVLESPRLCRLILRWTSNRIVKCSDRRAVSFWCHIAANPICVEILTNQARSLTLSPVVVFGSTTLYRLTDRLRNALQKQLTTLCLQSMLYASSRCELDELRASVESLLILIPCASPVSKYDFDLQDEHDLFEGITNAGTVMSDRNRWWSELFYTVWLQRYGSDPVSHSQVASSALQFESPPTTVLECPHTGILACFYVTFG